MLTNAQPFPALSLQAGPASDPASEVLLARDALLTLAEWGWAEAFTLVRELRSREGQCEEG